MSCDEAVCQKMGDGILADYTASLLSLATGKHIMQVCLWPLAREIPRGVSAIWQTGASLRFGFVMVAMVAWLCYGQFASLTEPQGHLNL